MLEDRAQAYSRSGTQSCRVQYRPAPAGLYTAYYTVDCDTAGVLICQMWSWWKHPLRRNFCSLVLAEALSSCAIAQDIGVSE